MGKVYYISYYDTLDSRQDREYFLSATNFMNYIIDKINSTNRDVEIVSMSPTKGTKIARQKKQVLNSRTRLKCFFSLGRRNSFLSRLDMHLLRLQMFFYLLFHVKKDDIVLAYHSINYANVLLALRKLKKFNFILQVAEIYQDVGDCFTKKQKKQEYDVFRACDGYIFSNNYLNEKLNVNNYPYVVIYGIYKAETKKEKFSDGKIHCVYAGTLDPRKGGAATAAAAMFLDEKYHVHILGDGGKKDKENLLKVIKDVEKRSKCQVTYHGLLKGDEFINFLGKCHIGLSTQKAVAKFNATSFPSKVLTYLCNGLQVVSIRLDAIEKSTIGDFVCFYDEDTPQAIAERIKQVKSINNDIAQNMSELDAQCEKEIDALLQLIESRR